MQNQSRTLAIIALILAAVALVAGVTMPQQAQAPDKPILARGTTHLGDLDLTGNLVAGGYVSATGVFTYAELHYDGNAVVTGNEVVSGTQRTVGNATYNGTVTVDGAAALNGGITADTTAFTVANTSGNVRTAGTLAVEGASTLTGTVTTIGAVTIGAALTHSTFSLYTSESITPTNGGTIDPAASFVLLTPAGAVGSDLAACTNGEYTTIVNTINAAVTISETASARLSGDAVLGQWDSLTLLCVATVWTEIAQTDN